MDREEELATIKMINFANEFLKVAHGIKKESDRADQLPDEIQEYLANEYLDRLLKEENLEPEMLIWGLVNIMEIVLKIADFSPDQLSEVITLFVKQKRAELNG
jgi:hypothetical protein